MQEKLKKTDNLNLTIRRLTGDSAFSINNTEDEYLGQRIERSWGGRKEGRKSHHLTRNHKAGNERKT